MKYPKLNNISSEAVEKATGKPWDEWIKIIDKGGGAKMTHKEIAIWLRESGNLDMDWWGQMVTVGYEFAKNRRIKGETADSGFEIGVTKTLDAPPQKVWDLLISKKGLKICLGEIKNFQLEKGFKYETSDGTKGQIRTLENGKKIRLTYQPKNQKNSSTLQIYVLPSKEKTSLRFHQEKLLTSKDRQKMKTHWQKVIQSLEVLI